MKEEFNLNENTSAAIGTFRCSAVLFKERSEFYQEKKAFAEAKKFQECRDYCAEKIHEIILDSIIQYDRKNFGDLMKMPSEMYEDCENLGRSIARFSVFWGLGKDPEFWEGVWELEDEIVICYEALMEGKNELLG
jgi:hypothetical protein